MGSPVTIVSRVAVRTSGQTSTPTPARRAAPKAEASGVCTGERGDAECIGDDLSPQRADGPAACHTYVVRGLDAGGAK